MRHFLKLTGLICLLATSLAHAAHTEVRLLLPTELTQPGTTILAGVDLKMDSGWHTYWKNPGSAGIATEIKWQLPPGVTAGEIQWPLPHVIPPAEVATYGYEKEVVLLVPLTLDASLKPGPLVLKADVSWLECQEQCVPGKASVQTTLDIGNETKASSDAASINEWKNKLPKTNSSLPFRAAWESTTTNDTRSLLLELPVSAHDKWLPITGANFFPDASDAYEVQTGSEMIARASTEFAIRKLVKKFSGDWPSEISGVMILEHNGDREGYQVKLSIAENVPAGAVNYMPPKNTASDTQTESLAQPLWKMLLYAFIGGLILNIMPCVLPVIALKILGFVSEAGSSPGRLRVLGGIYGVGVLTSFVALAAIVIAIKSAGHLAGWGMQFGNPVFLVCLTTLVTLVALNLFGVFEVTLGGGALDAAGALASKHGAAGAFFNGVLATVLATPCTAPILGTALGFAFAQGAVVVLLIFLTVGLGLATPYVVLCWNPNWLKLLPKPGAWMEKFKISMGFPMLATAIWLLNVSAATYGKNVFWLGIFLVIAACAAWVFGEFFQRGRKHRSLALAITALLLFTGYAYALEEKLRWRAPQAEAVAAGSLKESPDGIDWKPWSPAAVAKARSQGKIVLVDFTADWCATCLLNKATSIEIPSVRAKLKELNAVAFIGDYTRTPDSILEELNRFSRAGVPLVLVYPKDAAAPAMVLPGVLTPGIVLDALDRASVQ